MPLEGQLLLGLLEGVVTGFVLSLTALGLSLVFGVMRIVNIAHGEFFMLGAVGGWVVWSASGSFLLALLAAPLVAGAIALAADRAVLRPIEYEPHATIVATIGLLYIIQQVVLITYGPYARAVAPPIYFRVDFPWFGYSGYKLIVAVFSSVLLLATWLLITRTRLGLYMRATQQDREMAQAFGVPVTSIYAGALALGAVLAAVAGVLVVPIQQAHYLMGLDALLLSFMVVIIGGLGRLQGTVAAAFLIGLIDGAVSVLFSPTLARIAAFTIVALVLVFRSEGLFGGEGM